MSSKIIKCKTCNIVISEVLAFIQSKADVMDDESMVRLCTTAFSSEEIDSAKTLLFDSVSKSKQKKTRRRQGKTHRDIDDIITLIRSCEPEDMPIFVAKDLYKLPPVTFDHVDVTRLLKDIIIIQRDLREVQETYLEESNYATTEQLENLKMEIAELKKHIQGQNEPYVNYNRGAFTLCESPECISGPMGLLQFEEGSPTLAPSSGCKSAGADNLNVATVCQPSLSPAQHTEPQRSCISLSHSVKSNEVRFQIKPITSQENLNNNNSIHDNEPKQLTVTSFENTLKPKEPLSEHKSIAEVLKNGTEHKTRNEQSEWTVVQNRKQRHRASAGCVGKAATEKNAKFRAAENGVPLFITNVSKEASEQDVAEYIQKKN